ncbi:MAG TPA: hypothetical protein VF189_00820 [Patescibacteria group bacterium]
MQEQESDYIPSNYPQKPDFHWGKIIRSMSPIRATRYINNAFKKWRNKYDEVVKVEPPLEVISKTPVRRTQGNKEYDVYESTLPDARSPQDRLNHPGWKKAFEYHP